MGDQAVLDQLDPERDYGERTFAEIQRREPLVPRRHLRVPFPLR